MALIKTFEKITGNFRTKCEFCKKEIKKKDAHIREVKLLEFVHPRKAAFCSKSCCSKYKYMEENTEKKASTCSMCPIPPGALEK